MSDWLLRRSYGFGEARVALCAEPHVTAGADWTVREGVRQARASAGTWRDVIGLTPAIVMGVVITLAPLLAQLQQSLIAPEIDLVVLETAARSEPPPAPAIPRPPPVEVVEVVEELPPPAEPAPPEPPPVVAAVRPPPPPAPRPAAPPRIEPVPLAAPAPETAPRRSARSNPRVASTPAFKPAIARIDALATTEVAAAGSPTRRSSPRSAAADRRAPPSVRFDASMPTAPAVDEAVQRGEASRRELQREQRPLRRKRPAGVALPAALAPETAPQALAAAQTQPPSRSERPRDNAPAGNARASRPGVAGVALASLASCRTDAQEDDLKQRVLAEIAGRSQCESSAGRYVFVETRNLNAFLMYVQRPPARREADRCVELSLALDCLRQRGGTKAGRV